MEYILLLTNHVVYTILLMKRIGTSKSDMYILLLMRGINYTLLMGYILISFYKWVFTTFYWDVEVIHIIWLGVHIYCIFPQKSIYHFCYDKYLLFDVIHVKIMPKSGTVCGREGSIRIEVWCKISIEKKSNIHQEYILFQGAYILQFYIINYLSVFNSYTACHLAALKFPKIILAAIQLTSQYVS